MSSLETVQSIWETATKKFNKIDNKEKEEWFLSLIDQINENNAIQWCKKQWNQMTEETKNNILNKEYEYLKEYYQKYGGYDDEYKF